jgi:enoyl-CoA hydratase/carnithine racemase
MGNSGSSSDPHNSSNSNRALGPVTSYEPENESAWNPDGSLNMLSTREKLRSQERHRVRRGRARQMQRDAQRSCAKGCGHLTRSALSVSLVALNLVFLVGAVVLLAVGSLVYVRLGAASQFADVPVGIGLMVVAGLVFLLSLIGCAGAYLEHKLLMKVV